MFQSLCVPVGRTLIGYATPVAALLVALVVVSPCPGQEISDVVAHVSGGVFDATTTRSIACADVVVRYTSGALDRTLNATSDGGGGFFVQEFELPLEELSRIQITIQAEGYVSETVPSDTFMLCNDGEECACGTLEYCSYTVVPMTPESTAKGATASVGSVSGSLRDSTSGLLLARYPTQLIPVTIDPSAKQGNCVPDMSSVSTGDDGQFKYDYVAPGRYKIRPVETAEFTGVEQEITVAAGPNLPVQLQVQSKSTFQGTIFGNISDSDSGVTIGEATVIARLNEDGIGAITAVTENGTYTFLNIPAGQTRIDCMHHCYWEGGTSINVQDGESVNANILLVSLCNPPPLGALGACSVTSSQYSGGVPLSDLLVLIVTLGVLARRHRVCPPSSDPMDVQARVM